MTGFTGCLIDQYLHLCCAFVPAWLHAAPLCHFIHPFANLCFCKRRTHNSRSLANVGNICLRFLSFNIFKDCPCARGGLLSRGIEQTSSAF